MSTLREHQLKQGVTISELARRLKCTNATIRATFAGNCRFSNYAAVARELGLRIELVKATEVEAGQKALRIAKALCEALNREGVSVSPEQVQALAQTHVKNLLQDKDSPSAA